MTNNMALSGQWENVILIKIILTTDGTVGYAKSDTWWQMVWHITVGAGPHAYQCCMMLSPLKKNTLRTSMVSVS